MPRRLREEPDVPDGAAHRGNGHVVEKDPPGSGVERLVDLVERPGLGFEEMVPEARVQGAEVGDATRRLPDAPGAVGVVVLHEESVREAEAVVRPAAAPDGVPLEDAEAGRRLPRVEEDRFRPAERLDVIAGQRRDSREALHEVERRPLGGEDGDGGPLDPGENGSLRHARPVGHEEIDGGGRVEKGEEAGEEGRPADDGPLAADHGRRDAGGLGRRPRGK